jgi:KUP system potassium uptake protein
MTETARPAPVAAAATVPEKSWRGAAVIGALGIVFGDIGTSPLYAFREALAEGRASGSLPLDLTVLGILSLIIWALILVISVKYAIFILRADNRGEGGIIALLALLGAKRVKPGTWRAQLVVLGLAGTSLLYADGTITPAISVLSAVEGLVVSAPQFEPWVVPITLVILFCLFAVQRHGTGFIGRIFGPILLVWFIVIGLLGLGGIVQEPTTLLAFNPYYAVNYVAHEGAVPALVTLGAVFLAVTGGEAMYADLGHFGRFPIRAAWFAIVLPGLMLNYLGQGALILDDPTTITSPFYQLAPDWAHYPLVVLATVATVIASQAIIAGVFSLTQQAVRLGFLPRLRVVHTAREEIGQIYVPFVNWGLAFVTLGAVIAFGSSSALAGAYGLAVSVDMAITTILAAVVALRFGYTQATVFGLAAVFIVVDLGFVAANSMKFLDGGWFPVLLACIIAFLMLTWRAGQRLLEKVRKEQRLSTEEFLQQLEADPPLRVPGTAAFLTPAISGIPQILVHHLKHNRVLHEQVYLLSALSIEEPRVPPEQRAEILEIGHGIKRVILRFGFIENPDVPWGLILGMMQGQFGDIDPGEITYYLGHDTIHPTARPGMSMWRESLFALMNRNAEISSAYFCIPSTQVIEIGMSVEI